MIEKNLTENSNGKQEQVNDNVVVLQSDIAEAMEEDELFRLRVVNKQLKEQIRIMGEAQVNKAIKEESDATNG